MGQTLESGLVHAWGKEFETAVAKDEIAAAQMLTGERTDSQCGIGLGGRILPFRIGDG